MIIVNPLNSLSDGIAPGRNRRFQLFYYSLRARPADLFSRLNQLVLKRKVYLLFEPWLLLVPLQAVLQPGGERRQRQVEDTFYPPDRFRDRRNVQILPEIIRRRH